MRFESHAFSAPAITAVRPGAGCGRSTPGVVRGVRSTRLDRRARGGSRHDAGGLHARARLGQETIRAGARSRRAAGDDRRAAGELGAGRCRRTRCRRPRAWRRPDRVQNYTIKIAAGVLRALDAVRDRVRSRRPQSDPSSASRSRRRLWRGAEARATSPTRRQGRSRKRRPAPRDRAGSGTSRDDLDARGRGVPGAAAGVDVAGDAAADAAGRGRPDARLHVGRPWSRTGTSARSPASATATACGKKAAARCCRSTRATSRQRDAVGGAGRSARS